MITRVVKEVKMVGVRLYTSMQQVELDHFPQGTVPSFVGKKLNMTNVSANELDLKVQECLTHFDIGSFMHHFDLVAEGQKLEILNQNERGQNLYYQWLSCLIKVVNPKQIVELGPASGISTIAMATQLDKDAKLYSVDIDKSLAWKWMKYDYPQVTKILGDDLDIKIWPKKVDLSKTDIWFIDTLHTKEQLEKEIKLYSPFFKKGAIVVLDDIRMEGLWDVWNSLLYDKCETTFPNHWSGFGHFVL